MRTPINIFLFYKSWEICWVKDKLFRQHKQSSEVNVSGRKAIIVHYCCTPCHFLFIISTVNCSQSFFFSSPNVDFVPQHNILLWNCCAHLNTATSNVSFSVCISSKASPRRAAQDSFKLWAAVFFLSLILSLSLYFCQLSSSPHFFSLDCFGPHHNL